MTELLCLYDWKVYYIDTIETNSHVSSRILLSCFGNHADLEHVDWYDHDSNSPILRRKLYHAVNCYDSDGDYMEHKLEVAIQVNDDMYEWLYSRCEIKANNHECANNRNGKGQYYDVCHKYNYFGNHCPYGYSFKHSCKLLDNNW